MKVGVLTFFRPINHGAVLQAYSLNQVVLKKLGVESELIDYRLPRIEYYRKVFNFKDIYKRSNSIQQLIHLSLAYAVALPNAVKRRRKFDKFISEKLKTSDRVYSTLDELEKYCQMYDAFIVGSDLVWNPEMTDGINPIYYLSFVKTNATKIAYAASVGTTSLSELELSSIATQLEKLDLVSTREEGTANQLQQVTNKKIVHVLDPSLLTDENDWEDLLDYRPKYSQYILAYMLEYSKPLIDSVNTCSKREKLAILAYSGAKYFQGFKVIDISTSGPDEFLSILHNATFVFTNSFHGCAFSIVFRRQFFCIPHSSRGMRMTEMLCSLGLKERILIEGQPFENNTFEVIDYDRIYELLRPKKDLSMRFLTQSLVPGGDNGF